MWLCGLPKTNFELHIKNGAIAVIAIFSSKEY